MANYCGECAHLQINGGTCFGEYYCEIKCKYMKANAEACSSWIKRPDGGYHRAGIPWYIVSAICKILGLGADCDLLTDTLLLKQYYLQNNADGIEFLYYYDIIGPIIALRLCEEDIDYVESLKNRFLIPCADHSKNKDFEKAFDVYQNMVNELVIKYSLQGYTQELPAKPLQIDGVGRVRVNPNEC